MDDAEVGTGPGKLSPVGLTPEDMDAVLRAMEILGAAMSDLGDQVEKVNDTVYTISNGGRAFTIDTDELEREAEDNEDFLKD